MGSASLQVSEQGHLPVQDFFEQTSELLDPLADTVRENIIPDLEQYDGRWHPSGYMVYTLGSHATLGSLRFHVWPRDLRPREDREGPLRDIHDHVLHISSIAVKGTYSDKIYNVTTRGVDFSDEEVASKGLLRVFTPPLTKSGSEALTTDGRVVSVRELEERIVPEGSKHTIEAGVFHAPTIPDDRIGATLSFSSYRVNLAGPHILVGGSADPIYGASRKVTPDEVALVKQQLIEPASL